jgi:hypothetical protein
MFLKQGVSNDQNSRRFTRNSRRRKRRWLRWHGQGQSPASGRNQRLSLTNQGLSAPVFLLWHGGQLDWLATMSTSIYDRTRRRDPHWPQITRLADAAARVAA